jgi:hypothetical protein
VEGEAPLTISPQRRATTSERTNVSTDVPLERPATQRPATNCRLNSLNPASGFEWNRFVDKHDRDVVANWVEALAVFTHETFGDLFRDDLSTLVLDATLTNALVEGLDEIRLRETNGRLVFRTSEDLEQFRVYHSGPPALAQFSLGMQAAVEVLVP